MPDCSRSSASASSRGCPTCSRGTRKMSCSARSTSSACATERTSSWRDTTSPRVLDLGDDRGVPQPAGHLRGRDGLVHDGAVSEPEVFDFPDGIGPVKCFNVEHEEVLLMPRWTNAKRVTFKFGLSDEFIQVLQVLHKIGARPHRQDQREGRRGLAARRRRGGPPRPRDARRQDERQDVRRRVGDRQGQGRAAALDVSVPRRRQRGHDGASTTRRRSPGRRRSTPSSRSSCSPGGLVGHRDPRP